MLIEEIFSVPVNLAILSIVAPSVGIVFWELVKFIIKSIKSFVERWEYLCNLSAESIMFLKYFGSSFHIQIKDDIGRRDIIDVALSELSDNIVVSHVGSILTVKLLGHLSKTHGRLMKTVLDKQLNKLVFNGYPGVEFHNEVIGEWDKSCRSLRAAKTINYKTNYEINKQVGDQCKDTYCAICNIKVFDLESKETLVDYGSSPEGDNHNICINCWNRRYSGVTGVVYKVYRKLQGIKIF